MNAKMLGTRSLSAALIGKIFYHGWHGFHGWGTRPFLSVASGKSVVEFLRWRLGALSLLCQNLLFVFTAFVTFPATAQIQQAWVARYNNGIPTGSSQAVKMALDSSGNIYVSGVSQNANNNLGYVTIKYAPNGNPVWASRYDSASSPSATRQRWFSTAAMTSLSPGVP